MKKFINNLKTTAQNHPVETIIAVSLAVSATAKLLTAVTNAKNSSTWAKEVDRRTANSK